MPTPSTAPMQPPNGEPTINTAGGAYVAGNVFAETFIGRDQYNYYFVGLAPLVHDPTRRFRNFLNEYLGTPEQPVPFGGRQVQLDELHSWLNDVNALPYYLMTAKAGRGKSALVCRWMEEVRQQRPTVEVIFIPISIRFETAAQDVVFAALAARLAQIYDEPMKPAALSGAQWQGICESYLDRTPPAGKQLLIILDGLDEATGWQFGAGFFSTTPPPGLRIVVTARSIEDISLRDNALCSLNPLLPAVLLAEELAAARSIKKEAWRVMALGNLAPHLPADLLVEALAIARSVKSEECRTRALVDLVPRLPVEQRLSVLEETLTLVCSNKVFDRLSRVESLSRLAQTLTDWVQLANGSAYQAWCKTLPVLATRPRPEFLGDLAALMPFILALAGDEAPQAADGIYHALQEVCEWWP